MKHALAVLVCSWTFFGMFQDGSLPAGYWWKPIRPNLTDEVCRGMVLQATQRPRVGLIAWYHFPYKAETAPAWLKAVMDAKPDGAAPPWVGCLPAGYNPDEPR